MMKALTLPQLTVVLCMIRVGCAFQTPHREPSIRTTASNQEHASRTQRHLPKLVHLSAGNGDDNDADIQNSSESIADKGTNKMQPSMVEEIATTKTPLALLAEVSNPKTLFQEVIHKYWEEFDKDVFARSSEQHVQHNNMPTSSWPSVATILQVLQLLSEIANNPDVDGQLTVLEAWRESMRYRNTTVNTGNTDTVGADSQSGNSVTAYQRNFEAVNRTKWIASWNEGLTNDDVRDVGDHIWRYLIGDWSRVRRNKVLLSLVRAVCIAVLTWGLIESLLTSFAVSGVWTWTALTQQLPHTWRPTIQHREILFQSYTAFRLRLDPVFFALKALGTLVLVPYYENLVCTVERVSFSQNYRQG